MQRLKGERDVVSEALARLPKDLDETYDRIFLRIPQEDWQFVSHAFQWLWFRGEPGTPYSGTPSVLLLDAIKSSTSRPDYHNSHVLYNSERLRELCGCLITSLADSISFAHYSYFLDKVASQYALKMEPCMVLLRIGLPQPKTTWKHSGMSVFSLSSKAVSSTLLRFMII